MGTTNIYMTTSDDLGSFGSGVTGHEGAIELLSFDCSVQQVGDQTGGKPRSVEAVVPGDFNITKAVDGTSPLLFKWCCIGEYLSTVTIGCFSTVSDTPYLEYKLKGVHIAKWNPSSKGGLPTESIALKYGRLTVKYDHSGLGGVDHGIVEPPGAVDKQWSWVIELPV